MVVPDFGGFMAHRIASRYADEDHAFLPPLRTLGFNPQLKMNDSVLVQSYVEAYDISYPEALKRIELEVEELKRLLGEHGSYTMEDLGILTVNQDGNYEFTPCEAGILSPTLYGLGSFNFCRLKDAGAVVEEKPQEPAADETAENEEAPLSLIEFTDSEKEDTRVIEIKMSWIRNAVAVAAAVVAFFLIATPIANSDLNTRTMSQLQGQLLYKLMPQDTNVVPAEPVLDVRQTAESETAEAQPQQASAAPAATKAVADDKPYCIVLASQVKESNAEAYVEQLHKKGYQEASVYIYKNIVRVIYGSYQTEADARRQLKAMNSKEGFEEAWIYKKKA